MSPRTADVAIIGDGVIGLSTTYELARAGISCVVIGASNPGAASGAAAGLLAPSIGQLPADVAAFFNASLDLYPAWIEALREFDSELRLLTGLIEVFASQQETGDGAERLSSTDLAALEPSLAAPFGGVVHARDGAIDNVRLISALRRSLERGAPVDRVDNDPVVRVALRTDGASLTLSSGETVEAGHAVLAAGAWSPLIEGLPRALPVRPLKGQMLAYESKLISHPVMGEDIYLVPRGDEIAVGATAEDAGFDISTTPEGIDGLRRAAEALLPKLSEARVAREWAGLRPATPDRLPILGPDPEFPALIYACGHTKNGILLAPQTARTVVGVVAGKDEELAAFRVDRF